MIKAQDSTLALLLLFASPIVAKSLAIESIRKDCLQFSTVKIGKSAEMDARECKPVEFGDIGLVEGRNYSYVLYCLIPVHAPKQSRCGDASFEARYHANRGLAVFSMEPKSKFAELEFERADPEIGSLVYEKPELVDVGNHRALILNIRVDGTGNGNSSEYYSRHDRKWVRIESETWQKSVREKIPAGLEIRKGVWPNLKTMTARTGLYKNGDANCCPTGGEALIALALENQALVTKKVTLNPSRE